MGRTSAIFQTLATQDRPKERLTPLIASHERSDSYMRTTWVRHAGGRCDAAAVQCDCRKASAHTAAAMRVLHAWRDRAQVADRAACIGCGARLRIAQVNLDLLRSYFAISEFGSLSKAAEQLHVSQSTLTRQVQALETEIGGQLLERGHTGVALTAAGHALLEGMRPVVARADIVVSEARKLALGQSASLRIGYLMSAAGEYLNPAIAALRRSHPETKVRLVDLSPGEQMAALRKGELDVAVLGNTNAALEREFFVRRIATLPVVVALPENHPLAVGEEIALADLRRELFVGAHPEDIPGFNAWMTQLCRRASFRPKIVENADSLTHTLSLLVAENAVTLLPGLVSKFRVPGVAFRPMKNPAVTWDLQVAWQRGKITEPVRELVNLLTKKRA